MASRNTPPDYYRILEIPENATDQQIRTAYKKAALKTHPDRVAADSPERPARTRRFQLVNDAYFTLSDKKRRKEYDAQRKLYSNTRPKHSSRPSQSGRNNDSMPGAFNDYFDDPEEDVPGNGNSNFSWAWDFFSKGQSGANSQQARQEAEDAQFADAFEEMLREEGMAQENQQQQQGGGGKFWALAGGAAGGILGFIAGNVPGAIAGVVAGNRFGAIRDAKGKSVYEVYQELPQDERMRLLAQLAARVFSHAVGR